MNLSYPNEIELCLDLLNNEYEAYIVGGAVRNKIMDLPCLDYDITTSATPNQILEVFKDYRVFLSGIIHGSVEVLIDKTLIQITSYRIESQYLDHRHPKEIEFTTDIKKDLIRRDFTINTLCYNNKDKILDHFNALNDLENKILKTINEPNETFKQDPLRILRAIRIASQLNFEIDKDTKNAIHNNIESLQYVTNTRFSIEFLKFIESYKFCEYIKEYADVFSYFIPELNILINNKDTFEKSLESINNTTNLKYRMALLFVNLNPNSSIQSSSSFIMMAKRLNFNNEVTSTVARFIQNAYIEMINDKPLLKKRLNQFGDSFFEFLDFRSTYDLNPKQFKDISSTIARIIENNECCSLKQLNINGDDLKEIGITGSQISLTLNKLLDLVIHGKVVNNKYKLLDSVTLLQKQKKLAK